ncbi:type III pantothenate kinase, partial [Alistipes onderdonkii]
MNLVVDIGNTLVKLAVFDRGELVAQRCTERLHPSMLEELLSEWPVRRAVV